MRRQVYLYSGPLASLTPWLQPGVQVVLPNRLAAQTLEAPTATTLESLADQLLEKGGLAIAGPLLVTRTLQELPASGGELASPLSLLGPIRELLETGPVLDSLIPRDYPETVELMTMAQHYRKALKNQKLVDPAERFWQASAAIREKRPLLVYGSPWLDKGALTFLNALAAEGSTLFLPALSGDLAPETRESLLFLKENGWQVDTLEASNNTLACNLLTRFNQDPAPSHDAVQGWVSSTLDAEARAVLGNIKQQLINGASISDIVIVPSDMETYQPVLEAVAWEYGLPLATSSHTLLKKTLLGTWLTLLAEVIEERFPYEATLRLLQHPFGPKLEAHQLAQIYRHHPTNKSGWLFQELEWLSLIDWPNKASRQEWVTLFERILTAEQAELSLAQWPIEKTAQTLLLETLRDWAESQPDDVLHQTGFLHELSLMLQVLPVTLDTEPEGIAVLAPEQVTGAQIPHLYVLGVMEEVMPLAPKNLPALSFQTRNKLVDLGVPLKSLVKMARQEALRFYSLLHCPTETLRLSYPKLIGNKAQLPSPYFDALNIKPQLPPAIPPCSLEEGRQQWLNETGWDVHDTQAATVQQALTVETNRELHPIQDEYDGVTGLPLDWQTYVFTATQLTSLGQCPFRWWAGYALKLADPDESDEALSASIKGSFYHKVLELAFEKSTGSTDLAEAVPRHLAEAFTEAEEQLRMAIIIPSWKMMRMEHLAKLRQLVETPELYGEAQEVLSLEKSFESTWHGLRIRGKVDRIDKTATGTVVIDYKTSGQAPAGVQDDTGKAILDLQLPLYVEGALPELVPESPATDAYYFSLTKGKVLARLNPEQQGALEGFVDEVKARFESGAFPVSPDIEGKSCNYCSFDLLCRQSGRLSNKTGEPAHE